MAWTVIFALLVISTWLGTNAVFAVMAWMHNGANLRTH
jgi:hypothetical protein